MIGLIVLGIMIALIVIVTLIRQVNYIRSLEKKNKELIGKHKEDLHNHTIIVEKDTKIFSLLTAIENLVTGKRTDKEVRVKIKELLSHR